MNVLGVGVAFNEVTANHCRMNRRDRSGHLETPLYGGHVGRLLVSYAVAVVDQIASPVNAGQARRRHVDLDQRRVFFSAGVIRQQAPGDDNKDKEGTQHGGSGSGKMAMPIIRPAKCTRQSARLAPA